MSTRISIATTESRIALRDATQLVSDKDVVLAKFTRDADGKKALKIYVSAKAPNAWRRLVGSYDKKRLGRKAFVKLIEKSLGELNVPKDDDRLNGLTKDIHGLRGSLKASDAHRILAEFDDLAKFDVLADVGPHAPDVRLSGHMMTEDAASEMSSTASDEPDNAIEILTPRSFEQQPHEMEVAAGPVTILRDKDNARHELPYLRDKQTNATYKPDRYLGRGGRAEVWGYKDIENHTFIAVKILKSFEGDDSAEREAVAVAEADKHARAAAGDPEHVVGFRGACRTEDGQFIHAMDYMRHGDAAGALERIEKLILKKRLTPEQAIAMKLYLVRATALGVGALAERGLVHRDVKIANVFIDGSGAAKLGDFGETLDANTKLFDKAIIDSPFHQSPESLADKQIVSEATEFCRDLTEDLRCALLAYVDCSNEENWQALANCVASSLPEDETSADRILSDDCDVIRNKDMKKSFSDKLVELESQPEACLVLRRALASFYELKTGETHESRVGGFAMTPMTSSDDLWGVGVMAAETLCAKKFNANFADDYVQKVAAWRTRGGAFVGQDAHALFASSGKQDIDAFLNSILSSDQTARARLKPAAIADHKVMRTYRASTDEARYLLHAVANYNSKSKKSKAALALAKTNFDKLQIDDESLV